MTLSKYTPAVAAMALIAVAATAGGFTRYVNPFIGTGNIEGGLSGNCYPGATVPFGMVQVCADTHPRPTGIMHRVTTTTTPPSTASRP